MNDRALAKVDPAHIERDPMRDWEVMRQQAEALVKSRLLPRAVDTPEKAIAIIQTGRELGIGPMQALRSIHVIEGKPTMSAELMAGLVLARLPGSLLRVASTSNEECTVEAGRQGQQATLFRFSMADARAAGLVGKDNWKKYPAAMLRARCLAMASRAVFPDATMGMLDPDEVGAITTEGGEVVSFEPQVRAISPHSHPDEDEMPSAADPDVAAELLRRMEAAKAFLQVVDSYDKALQLREILGSAGKQSQLTRDVQAAKEARAITPEQHKELSKIWQHCNRQCAKLEKELAPSAEGVAHASGDFAGANREEHDHDPADDFDR